MEEALATPFLMGFAEAVVGALAAGGGAEIAAGQEGRVVVFVANYLAVEARGGSVISELGKALEACPEVEELYLDDMALKELVDELARVRR